MKALVVDDSKLARITLRKLLVGRGLQVEMAESGQEALEYLKTAPPNVVFMDHQMPNMDGFEAMRSIKENPDMQHIPVIMCTGQEDANYYEKATSNGASGILSKPPVTTELEKILADIEQSSQTAFVASEPSEKKSVSVLVKRLDALEQRFESFTSTSSMIDAGQITDMRSALDEMSEKIQAVTSTSSPSIATLTTTATEAAETAVQQFSTEFLERHVSRLKSELADSVEPQVCAVLEKMPQPAFELGEQEMNKVHVLAGEAATEAVHRILAQQDPVQAVELAPELTSKLQSIARDQGADAGTKAALEKAESVLAEVQCQQQGADQHINDSADLLAGSVNTLSQRISAVASRTTYAFIGIGIVGLTVAGLAAFLLIS